MQLLELLESSQSEKLRYVNFSNREGRALKTAF